MKKSEVKSNNKRGLSMIDDFNVLLWAMWADCGRKKKFARFKKALETASAILNNEEPDSGR